MGAVSPRARTRTLARLLISFLALVLVTVATVMTMPAARAVEGINISILHNGAPVPDGASIPEGDPFVVNIQYNAEEAIDGTEITFQLPSNVSVPGALAGNEAVEEVVQGDDGTITVRFRDPIPADVSEGFLQLELQADPVDADTETVITWSDGTDSGSFRFVVDHEEVPPVEIPDAYGKSVQNGNLNAFVTNSGSPDYAFTGLSPAIDNHVITYTLTLDSSQAREGYEIADQLPAGLGYVAGSFEAQLTTFNPETTADHPFDPTVTGGSFSGTVDVPENSRLVITYDVVVTDPAVFETLLQAAYEARNGTPGNYAMPPQPNTATFGGENARTANVTAQGNIPGVGVGNAFAKTGDETYYEVIADEDGTLLEPAPMTYSFEADLTLWDERNPNFALTGNVVLRDQLVPQAQWLTGDADFITISGAGPITSLTDAGECPDSTATSAGAFAGDEYVGQYCVSGTTLLVNLGQDNSTDVVITAKAELTTVEGLSLGGTTNIIGGTSYEWPNEAQFFFNGNGRHLEWWDAQPVRLPDDREDGLNDSDAFDKLGPAGDVRVLPGETADVTYTFRIDTGKDVIDPLTSTIVDEIDTDIFPVEDLAAVPVTGSYGGTALTREHFDLSRDDDGNVVIELSEAGRTLVGSLAEGALWIVNATFTTIPFEGKETFEIYNRATLYGQDGEPSYWSDNTSEATSFGDEAELRKRVFDQLASQWTAQMNAPIEDGEFVNDTFVYALELIPRGSYGGVPIFTRQDVLPESVEFLGFVQVDEAGVPNLEEFSEGPITIPGNVMLSYEDGVVTFQQQPGTVLNPNQGRIVGYFAVQALDTTGDIVNSMGGSQAVIVPTGDPSIDIEKWNDEGEAPEYDATGALVNDGYLGDTDEAPGKQLDVGEALPITFTISNDGREDLVDIAVSDELTAGTGEIQDLVCVFPDGSEGTEWAGPFEIADQFECTGTLPAPAVGDVHADTATVTGVGIESGEVVEDEDDWQGYVPVPSVDIEKWNDEGEAPEYDATGALVNDGYLGDTDEAPGKPLAVDTSLPIRFTISNDGQEDLVDVAVSDQLTDGAGEIEDLLCVFPDGSEGTDWAGPFAVGTQFECTGTLPGLALGDAHADTATVTGVGVHSGVEVDDQDDWHAHVPVPSVDIEKWSEAGEAPEYDATGALINDGYLGDHDAAPGAGLAVDQSLPIAFTVSNDGAEDLLDLVVSDELIDGAGPVEDLVCVFPDGSEGTEWAGPFAVGTQFACTATFPGLALGETHADTASVTGVGVDSGVQVEDRDDWHARVPVPSVDIEKWSDEGEAPEYDATGALLNDGYDGDGDDAPGVELDADADREIVFTVSNDGQEDLVDVAVSDELTDGSGEIQDLVCAFPDGSSGTRWSGPFAVGTQFVCTGTLPALGADATHADLARVTATGVDSGVQVDDEDAWNGFTGEEEGGLAGTGLSGFTAALIGALLLTGLGAGALIVGRARRQV